MARVSLFATKPTTLTYTTIYKLIEIIIERIVLVGFLERNNRHSCELHPFGCGDSLVLNRDDWGVDLHLRLCTMKAANELACYIISSNGSDGVVLVSQQESMRLETMDLGWMGVSLR